MPATDFGYTGQTLDRSTGGLMYYGARYYLPSLRRFISADTVVPGAGNPQTLNRYSYTYNNPINLIDPSGHVGIVINYLQDEYKMAKQSGQNVSNFNINTTSIGRRVSYVPRSRPSASSGATVSQGLREQLNGSSSENDPGGQPQGGPGNSGNNGNGNNGGGNNKNKDNLHEPEAITHSNCKYGNAGYCFAESLNRFRDSTYYADDWVGVDKWDLAACQMSPVFCGVQPKRPLNDNQILIEVITPPLPAPVATRGIWTATSSLSPAQNALRHWNDHGADFPHMNNALEYQQSATEFINNPPSSAYVGTKSSNGDIVVYDPTSDVFAVSTADGTPRTMFIPDIQIHGYNSNLDYFLSNILR